MLDAIGIQNFDELLAPLPEAIRLKSDLNLPPALDEYNLVKHLSRLASKNADLDSHLSFLGAGIYDHFKPSVIGALQFRGEFASAYTPYQPEVSQGMLQAIYEYQTMICALTQMDLSNASMYDASTGLAEAALMAASLVNRFEIVVSSAVHPHYREVIQTYADSTGYVVVETPRNFNDASDLAAYKSVINSKTACVLVQHPNFFGSLEDVGAITEAAHAAGALSIVSVDPISLGLLKPPGEYDVDIVVGEGQSLGSPMGFGGPLLGFFACKKKYVRSFPGRIVGATQDSEGRRGYTMTLRTREQDIRREKATSNICTNQSLLALAATIYLCEMGKSGLRDVANLCAQKSNYAKKRFSEIPGVKVLFAQSKTFKEFVVQLPSTVFVDDVNKKLLAKKIIGGLALESYYPELANSMLVCVTETKSKADIDCYVAAVGEVISGRGENR